MIKQRNAEWAAATVLFNKTAIWMNSQPKGVEMEVAVRIHTVEKNMSYAFPSRLPLRVSAEQPILMHLHDK